MSNALFVDTSNLNVFFKQEDKFCLAVSYLSCPEKLIIDAQALGNCFDVYLSVWPRQEGEGDLIIQGLSIGGVPFVVLKEELRVMLDLVEKIPGVDNIYVCNALANFYIPARVANFKSVICYGNRYALVTVQDKLLADLKVFDNQQQFVEVMGEDFTCYGDTDIIDVDTLKAQYPELGEFRRNIIVSLTPLITSYRSNYRLTSAEVHDELDNRKIEQDTPKVEEPKKQAPIVEPDDEVLQQAQNIRTKKPLNIDVVSLIFCVITFLAVFAIGLGSPFYNVENRVNMYSSEKVQFDNETTFYQDLSQYYTGGTTLATNSADLLAYANESGMSIAIDGLEAYVSSVVLTFSCNDTAVKDDFVSYISAQYAVASVSEFNSVSNTDGTVTTQYGIMLVYS